MRSTLKGIVIASVVVYVWGFLYWGVSPVPYMAWSEAPDDRAAGQALLEHFPKSGVYYVPANGNPPDLRAELYGAGPTGFVILDRDGRAEMDPAIMAQGFLLNVVVVCLLALLMRFTIASAPRYSDRLRIFILVGAIAVVFVDFGRAVWWLIPWPWVLAQSFYDFTAVAIVGAILAHFVKPSSESADG